MTNMLSARLAGICILISTSSYMTASQLLNSVFRQPDFMVQILPNAHLLSLASLLEFVNSATLICASIVIYPIVRQCSERIAMTYVAFRIVEGVLLLAGAVLILSVLDMGNAFAGTQGGHSEFIERLTKSVLRERFNYFQMGMLALSFAGFTLAVAFYRYKLVPRTLAALGMLGYAVLLLKVLCDFFDIDIGGQWLFLPGALFEFLLPLWLLVKGFNTAHITPKKHTP